jgi:PAS domain S-box-containing protein
MQTFIDFFGIKNFIPHGFCLSWNPVLLWLHVASDLLITLSYYSIPFSLFYFIRKRKDLPYAWLIFMFGLFIVACGTTHLMSAVLIWIPLYWLDGYLKVFTAIISIVTAIAMLRIIPLALKLPNAKQLQFEINERKRAELAQKETAERFDKIANQLPSVVFQFRMRADGSFCIPYANEVLRDVYRLSPEEVRDDASAIFAVTHPDDLESHIEKIKKSARELSPWRDEYRLKFTDGTECWLAGNALPQREADGSTLWHGVISNVSERKQIQNDILTTKNKLQSTINAIPDVLFELDIEGRIYDHHAHPSELFSLKSKQILGKKLSEIIPIDAATVCLLALKEALQKGWSTGKQISLELDGGMHWFELSVAIKPSENEPGFIMLSRNITERKHAEQELRESEARLRTIIDISPVPMALNDNQQNITFLNNAFIKTFGYDLNDIPKLEIWWERAYPDLEYRQWVLDTWANTLKQCERENKTVPPLELSICCKDGTQKTVLVSATAISNSFDLHLVALYDITERKQNEEKLQKFFNIIPDLLCIVSDGYFININPAWKNVLGHSEQTLLSTPFREFIHPDDIEATHNEIHNQLFAGKLTMNFLNRYRHKNGQYRWLEWQAVASSDNKLLFASARDITERKAMEAELKRSNADLEQFAYAVSHDMRQPLRMVTSYLGLIETALKTQLDEDTRQFLTFAIDGSKRMDAMILSLLDYSRVGKSSEALSVISSRAAVDEAILFLKPTLESCGGTVEVLGNWVDLVANRDELTRLFQNLIGNALKYHDENKPPVVEVLASITSNKFRVEVRDNGIGIDPSQQNRLFKVFSRLQARSHFEGTGIGLALCRKIVEHHGGSIGVTSEGEGLGCTFWFELPRKPIEG